MNWDFAVSDARTDAKENYYHILNGERTQAALGPSCLIAAYRSTSSDPKALSPRR